MREGWHISDLKPANYFRWMELGPLVGAAHARLSKEAWALRPAPAFDIAEWLAPASVRAKESVQSVGYLVSALDRTNSGEAAALAKRLSTEWNRAVAERRVQTVSLCQLVMGAQRAHTCASDFLPALKVCAELGDDQSWLAAYYIYRVSGLDTRNHRFPDSVDMAQLLKSADFSIASHQAKSLFSKFSRGSVEWQACVDRLASALEGEAPWELDGELLLWFSRNAPRSLVARRFDRTVAWFRRFRDGTALAGFLAVLPNLSREDDSGRMFQEAVQLLGTCQPEEQPRAALLVILHRIEGSQNLKQQVLRDAFDWLRTHPDDRYVRSSLLAVVHRVGASPSFQKDVLRDVVDWLRFHADEHHIRSQLLAVLHRFDVEQVFQEEILQTTLTWLEDHDEDLHVRSAAVKFLEEGNIGSQAAPIIASTVRWLARHSEATQVRQALLAALPKHWSILGDEKTIIVAESVEWVRKNPDDANVRCTICSLMRSLPDEFDPLRESFILDTIDWLEIHRKDVNVRGALLRLLRSRKHPELVGQAGRTLKWLRKRDSGKAASPATSVLGILSEHGPSQMAEIALRWASDYLRLHLHDGAGSTIVPPMVQLYSRLQESGSRERDPVLTELLADARAAITAWRQVTGADDLLPRVQGLDS
jgi:hypothetical protein